MSVQNRVDNSNLQFVIQQLPIAMTKVACTVKQDAARVAKIAAGTVMAYLSSAKKWIPLANTAENAASQATGAAPYVMAAGDTLVIDVDNAGNETATFDAASGYVASSNEWPIADATGKTIKVKIDGGAATQTITLSTCTTVAQLIATANAQLVGASVIASTTHALIISDTKGTGSSVEIVAGGTAADITFGAATAGTGDVVNIDAVTAAELKTVVEADTTAVVTVAGTGAVFTSPTLGEGSELEFVSGNVLTAIGVSASVVIPSSVDGGTHPQGFVMQDVAAADLVAGDVTGVSILFAGAVVDEGQVVFEGGVTKDSVVSVAGLNKTVEQILNWNNLYLEGTVNIDEFEN